jgi:hypothetical protein
MLRIRLLQDRIFALATAVAILCFAFSTAEADLVSGVVREEGTLTPIPDAIVSLQATDTKTISLGDGSYSLDVGTGTDLVIVAAQKGYYNGSILVTPPSSGEDILLDPVPQGDNSDYSLMDPLACEQCHPDQYDEWLGSPMSKGGTNTWVHDIYSGTGTPGGMGGFVYLRDSVHAGTVPDSECAACHQPESWIANDFSGPLDDTFFPPQLPVVHGVSCEVCHKVANIDESKTNFPGIHPDAVTFTRPEAPDYAQVEYGLLPDADFSSELMRPSYQPQLVAEVCAACHQDKNDPDEDGDFEEDNGVISEPTYLEWLNTPYGDIESPQYATCLDCHMLSSGQTELCSVLDPPLTRDPEKIRSHVIEGTTAAFLENAVDLAMQTNVVGNTIEVQVDITNSQTGHHVPTGVTIRNMVLLVQAWTHEDDPFLSPLTYTGMQTIHPLGGEGNPTQGYYSGLPGKYYSKLNHDASMNGPTFFTDATGIQFDNRIPALATDITNYTFTLPPPSFEGWIYVRARLIYRRTFRFLADAKQWTQDGHGNVLEDVTPPYYGHLMESAQEIIFLGDGDADEDGVLDSEDNCRTTSNPGQEDISPPQGNGIGDACDCESDFNCDGNVDATDVPLFLDDFGRSTFFNPCTNANPCNGDFDCNVNVDADDVTKFLEDFGRSQFFNPCPACEVGLWCLYP